MIGERTRESTRCSRYENLVKGNVRGERGRIEVFEKKESEYWDEEN